MTLPKDHCVQIPWEYINVCGHSDQFCKNFNQDYHILRTTNYILHMYRSHCLLLNTVQARQKWVLSWVFPKCPLFGVSHSPKKILPLRPELKYLFKGCGMGPWLVLVSPCFRENEVATCKIGSFLCSLDNLLQKNVIVFFFGNQISKWRSFEKRAIFDLLFTFFSYRGKVTKIPFSTYLTHIHTRILLTLLTFFALPILKKIRIYQIRFLFGMSPGVDSYSRHFGTINK